MTFQPTLKLKILNQKHLDYNAFYATQMDLLYAGGKDILSNASLFIPKEATGEQPRVHQQRLLYASYHNHMGEIINAYGSDLFSHSFSVVPAPDANDEETEGDVPDPGPFWDEFAKDADFAEHSFQSVVKEVFTRAARQAVGYLGIDFPDVTKMDESFLHKEMAEVSIFDIKAFGLERPYTYHIPYQSIINWKYDDFGRFLWCVIYDCSIPQETFDVDRTTKVHDWKVWQFTEQGQVEWGCYQKVYNLNDAWNDEDDATLIDSGVVSFKRIPIKVLRLPPELVIGSQLYSMAVENFRLRTQINFGESRCANPILFFIQSDPLSGVPGEVADDEDRGQNIRQEMNNRGIFTGSAPKEKGDDLKYVAPDGEIYRVLNEQLKDNVNEMHRIHHLMASTIASKGNSNQQNNKSGDSKEMDMEDKAKVLTQYAMYVKNFAKECYEDITDALDQADVYWNVLGMDDFTKADPTLLLQETLATSQIMQAVPSPTFQKLKLGQIAMKNVSGVSPTIMNVIKKELDASVDSGALDKMAGGSQDPNAPANMAKQQAKLSSPPSQGINDPKPIGESGHQSAAEDIHLQSGQHIDSQKIYDQLDEDYKDKDIKWTLSIPWKGPMEVPLSSIDFSNADNWQASEDTGHVDMFADKIKNEGFSKPVILVNSPADNNKMVILDGHHRSLAYQQLNQPVVAYVGEIGQLTDEMKKMHSRQAGGKDGSKQISSQKLEKEASNQANKSAKAKNGKTK